VKYRRDIKYDAVVHADYARRDGRGRGTQQRAKLLAGVITGCAVALVISVFITRGAKHPPSVQVAEEPRERIGLRVPASSLQQQQQQMLARLPFEPRVPAPTVPKLLPASSSSDANWTTTEIRAGESLSIIFDRIGVTRSDAQRVLKCVRAEKVLQTINAGRTIAFRLEEGRLEELAYEIDMLNTVVIKRDGDTYSSELVELESDVRVAAAGGEITRSLFLDGRAAGLSDRLIMDFTEIFGWDVDFVLDLRRGDRFKVVYEEIYRGNDKVSNGRILGAEFNNRGRTLRALFYKSPDGSEGYYSENGQAMQKAFLRAPLNFTRISSRFNLARKHPVLNRIRAHRGVDYAAPMGTPIRAVANGKIEFAGTQSGYGNVIILRHGDSYSTLYGHLSKFAKNVARGKSVQQGQLIGYVGKSGLATGPHLHYEFRINNVHQDPLTVKLPRSISLDKRHLPQFQQHVEATVALLESITEEGSNDNMVANATRDRERVRPSDL
jgi:murein DD-endopeptidase MepM/ murein hydrolase activator NlpD